MKKSHKKEPQKVAIIEEKINNKIYLVRGHKVMFDYDLAELYQVETRILNQAVKRNIERFPDDFMFQITKDEEQNLRSQFVISSFGGKRYLPFAFTEQGVAMLSSVLRSNRAIAVNIQIMRIFTKLRQMILSYKDLQEKIEKLEKTYNGKFKVVFEALNQFIEEETEKEKIGFRTE